jgi:NitT/TauT family transport system substrate-binding protein
MSGSSISRRELLRGSVVGAMLSIPGIVRAQSLKATRPVSLLIDWVHQGPNAGFIVAKEKGFFSEVGLDVAINQGKGSGNTAQIVASKAAQFGFSDGYVVGNSVSKGMKLKMVAGVYRKNPTAVIVLDESAIKTPKDLEGQTIGIPTGSAQFQQWPAFAKGAGIDPTKVRVINVDPAGAAPALINGQVTAIAGFAQGWVPSIEFRGKKKARMFWYADCGVAAVSDGIIVHEDTLKEADLVRSVVRASMKGFLYGRNNPEEMAQIVKKNQEASEVPITLREAQLSWNTWVTPNTQNKPLGWMSDDDWKATVVTLKSYGGVTNTLEASSLFTNDFVPMEPEFIPPQNV